MRISKEIYHIKGPNKKIVLISDIHFYPKYNLKRLDMVYEAIKKIKPNYICIAGDLIDRAHVSKTKEINYFNEWIFKLGTICEVLITLGNHDYTLEHEHDKVYANQDGYKMILNSIPNVHVLDGTIYCDKDICFYGYNPTFNYYCTKESDKPLMINDFKKKMPILKSKYNVLLIHTPLYLRDIYDDLSLGKFNLILSGHTHGGLVPHFIKGNSGIIDPCRGLFPKYVRGHYKYKTTDFVISSGVVKFSHSSGILEKVNGIYPISITIVELSSGN